MKYLFAIAMALSFALTPASALSVLPQQLLYDFGIVPIATTANLDIVVDVGLDPGDSLTLTPQTLPGLFSVETEPCQLTSSGVCTFTASFGAFGPELTLVSTLLSLDFSATTDTGPVSGTAFVQLSAAIGPLSQVPLPAALPLLATGLGVLACVARRKKRQPTAA